ncbi:MAG: hypothetical protein FGM57_02535 [Candidatus Taylorbacteria bacterium]|nr:hypothetical protein [Candidatus Taylorbacteria bacterium]
MNEVDASFKDVKFNTRLDSLKFPLITHDLAIEKSVRIYKLKFPYSTTKNELYRYIDDNLDLKNSPKKKKMSFGLGLRLLEIEHDILARKNTGRIRKHEYIEQTIAEELLKRYGEKMSVDAIKKTILRTKKMVSEMNSN